MDFGAKIESLYDANGNAYHNSIHAADVCQSLNYIFRQNCVMNRGFNDRHLSSILEQARLTRFDLI